MGRGELGEPSPALHAGQAPDVVEQDPSTALTNSHQLQLVHRLFLILPFLFLNLPPCTRQRAVGTVTALRSLSNLQNDLRASTGSTAWLKCCLPGLPGGSRRAPRTGSRQAQAAFPSDSLFMYRTSAGLSFSSMCCKSQRVAGRPLEFSSRATIRERKRFIFQISLSLKKKKSLEFHFPAQYLHKDLLSRIQRG